MQNLPVSFRLRRRQEQARFIVGQLLQRMQMLTCFLAIIFFTEDIDIGPGPSGQDVAGNDEAVAAVIAFAAKQDDILAIPAFQPSAGPFSYGMTGIFHKDSRCDGIDAMHRYPIHIPHLSGSSDFLHSNFSPIFIGRGV